MARLLLIVSVSLMTAPGIIVAAESVSAGAARGTSPDPFPAFLTDVPPEAQKVAPVLRQVLQAVTWTQDAERTIAQLQAEQDGVKSKLTATNGELNVLSQQRDQLTAQVAAHERQQQERLDALRKELEAKLEQDLGMTRAQVAQEQEQETARQLKAFDAGHAAGSDRAVDEALKLKERELAQLGEEVQVQTQELVSRLSKLDVKADVAKAVERSTAQALQERKTQIDTQRTQLKTERDAGIAQLRQELIARLHQQQTVDLQRRLTLKEASLRSVMAELLHKTRQEEGRQVTSVRADLEAMRQRYAEATQRQALFTARLDSLAQELAAQARRKDELTAKRQASLARLEQTFQSPSPTEQTPALTWLGQTIQYLPPEIASELGLLQQRLMVLAQQAQQLDEQRRMLRERQLALQLSRQMESQYQQQQAKLRQDEEDRARRAEELIAKAEQLSSAGRYEDALQMLSRAQALNPPQLDRIALLRDDLLAAHAQARRQAQANQLEQLFKRAMGVFEQGRYDEAVKLFEQVIAQEATLEPAPAAAPSVSERPSTREVEP